MAAHEVLWNTQGEILVTAWGAEVCVLDASVRLQVFYLLYSSFYRHLLHFLSCSLSHLVMYDRSLSLPSLALPASAARFIFTYDLPSLMSSFISLSRTLWFSPHYVFKQDRSSLVDNYL